MAPAKKNSTPRKPTPNKAAKPVSTKKPAPNKSILSYFKKTEESLFIEDASSASVAVEEEEDIYGLADAAESRFNEAETSVKKRKLSPVKPDPEISASPESAAMTDVPELKHKVEEEDTSSESKAEATTKPAASVAQPQTRQTKAPVKGFHNPFIDDSSDEEDDGTASSAKPETSSATSQSKSPTTRFEPLSDERSRDETDLGIPQETARSEKVGNGVAPHVKEEEDAGSTWGNFKEDDVDMDYDENDLGEEYRAMRFMEEQARLEELDGSYSCDDELVSSLNDSAAQTCPICNGNLANVSAEVATAHVNACLDGNPTPLPGSIKDEPPDVEVDTEVEVKHEVEAGEISKRFARAAVPRPGQAVPFALGTTEKAPAGGSAFTMMMSSHAEDAAWATAAAAEHASRGQPAYKRTCPFYKIMPGFSICVDAFRYGAVQGCQAYFLSHFHSDHYIGLTANWTHGPIYCSKVTGSLVRNQLRTAERFVIELEFEERVPIPGTDAHVTMIPANHCPGSSLFLFEKVIGGRTQRILHCGDFRACPAHVAHPFLRPDTADAISGKTRQQKIDVCYLDTTYLNPRYAFPPQDAVIQACADLCEALNTAVKTGDEARWQSMVRQTTASGSADVSKFLTGEKRADAKVDSSKDAPAMLGTGNNNRLLIVCGTYSIGKERICKAIAQALKTKIFASAHKIRLCKQLGDPELAALMTSDPREAQVHMQMLMEIRAETLAEYLEGYRGHFSRIVGFRPSGWNYRPEGGKAVSASLQPSLLPTTTLLHGPSWRPQFSARNLAPQRGSGRDAMCFGVPYSEHSSFRELALFLMALRIEKVVPTVNVGSEASRKRMKGWIDRWLAERRKGGLIKLLEPPEGAEDAADQKKKLAGQLWDGTPGKGGGVLW